MQEKVKKSVKFVKMNTCTLCYVHVAHTHSHTIHKKTHIVASNNICEHVMRETVTLARFPIWTTNCGLHVVNHLVD